MEATVISCCVALSVTFFVYWLYLLRGERSAMPAMTEGEKSEVTSLAVRALLPYGRSIGTVIARRAAALELRESTKGYGSLLLSLRRRILRMIFAAGNPGGLTPDEFLGLVVAGGLGGLAVGGGLGLAAGRSWILILMALGGLLGFLLPLNWLRREARNRTRKIRKSLPYALDLLTLAVTAGLDFTEAMLRLARKLAGGPLGKEMGLTVRSIQLGRSRAEALRDLSWRVSMMEMSSVTGAIIQADELGSSMGPILRIQAEQIRTRRFHRAEEQAMKAPVKIIFPLALFILPTTLLIIFGSLAIPHIDKIVPLLRAKLGI